MLCNLIRERNNILIYGQARIGKKSLIQNSFSTLNGESYNFTTCNINLFNIRCIEAMMLKYTNQVLSTFSTSATEWNSFLKKYTPNAPYMIDENSIGGLRVTYTKKELLTDAQVLEILRLPDLIAQEYNTHLIIYFEQFQDILLFDDPHETFIRLEKGWSNLSKTNFIITDRKSVV